MEKLKETTTMLELEIMLPSFNSYQDHIPIGMSGASEPPQSMTSWNY
jgi:hypothetical protein